ncbi:MAG: energy transducer TonB [Deltaproteobacteria bacterium]|nr:energy transducer TonB [Deltaproteobacteria bacterium]
MLFYVAGVTPIRYYSSVRFDNLSLAYFFTLSLAAHLALFPLLWRKQFSSTSTNEPISVSFLPPSRPVERENPAIVPRLQPRRQPDPAKRKQPKRAPVIAKKPAPPQPQNQIRELPLPPQLSARTEPIPATKERPPVVEPSPLNDRASAKRGAAKGDTSIFRKGSTGNPAGKERLLPGIQDLASYNRPIPLNTQDPVLAPFTKIIESWIEAQWEYPDLAKLYGLQGKVTVEFTVLQNGHIDLLAVVRSSGSNLLDEEAIRAIKAASPFPSIPKSINANRLRIVAGFTYLNNRVAFTNKP